MTTKRMLSSPWISTLNHFLSIAIIICYFYTFHSENPSMYFCCIPQSCCYNQLSTTSPQSAITYCQFENSLCLCDLKLQLTAPFLGIKVNVQRWIFPPIWSFYTSILYFLPKWYGLMGGTISQFYSSLCRAVYLYYKNCSSNNFTVQIAFQQHWRRKMKKAPREMQTLHAGCSKMDPKVFAPPQTPFPAVRDGQNLISWRWSLSLPTNPVWWRSMHAISIYRGNRPTNKPTDRTDYNTLRRQAYRAV